MTDHPVEVEQARTLDDQLAADRLIDALIASGVDMEQGWRVESQVRQAFARHRLTAYRAGLEAAAKVASGWRSSLRPGNPDRALGHAEAAADIAAAIRTLKDTPA